MSTNVCILLVVFGSTFLLARPAAAQTPVSVGNRLGTDKREQTPALGSGKFDKKGWPKPRWWKKYRAEFGKKGLKKCKFIGNSWPQTGDSCPVMAHDYFCLLGDAFCCDAVCHPAYRCDCMNSVFTCAYIDIPNPCDIDNTPPTMLAPTTNAPVTSSPTTKAPLTPSPTTKFPRTSSPTSTAPVTSAPTSASPVSMSPKTSVPLSPAQSNTRNPAPSPMANLPIASRLCPVEKPEDGAFCDMSDRRICSYVVDPRPTCKTVTDICSCENGVYSCVVNYVDQDVCLPDNISTDVEYTCPPSQVSEGDACSLQDHQVCGFGRSCCPGPNFGAGFTTICFPNMACACKNGLFQCTAIRFESLNKIGCHLPSLGTSFPSTTPLFKLRKDP